MSTWLTTLRSWESAFSLPTLRCTAPRIHLSPHISRLLRRPYPAQALAIMGVARRWQIARGAHVVAECGAGKTLIALA